MLRRMILTAVAVSALTVLLAAPASAGIVSDPLGANGNQPVNPAGIESDPMGAAGNPSAIVAGTAPGGGPHINAEAIAPAPSITGGNGQDPIHSGAPKIAPAQIFPGAPEIAPAPSITGGNGQDPVGPQGVPQAGQQPLVAPHIVQIDGGCDDDQICGGMDDDQLIGWDDEALQPASNQPQPALNVFFGPIASDGYVAEAAPAQATGDSDGDGFADNDCDGQ